MKRLLAIFCAISVAILSCGCGNGKTESVFTDEEIVLQEYSFDGEKYICDGAAYRNKISVQGQSRNAEGNTVYVVLTNKQSVDFDAVDKNFWSSRRFSAGEGCDLPALSQEYVIVACRDNPRGTGPRRTHSGATNLSLSGDEN